MKEYLLPSWNQNTQNINNGSYIEALDYCLKESLPNNCREHYESMQSSETGFYACPYGLSTYVQVNGYERIIFTCFHERTTYKRKQAKAVNDYSKAIRYNPVLEKEQLTSLIMSSIRLSDIDSNTAAIIDLTNDTLHEIRSINGSTKAKCDSIWIELGDNNECDSSAALTRIIPYIKNIHASSYLIYSRFALYDFIVNPASQAQDKPFITGVYKKFDKMRKILIGHLRKKVYINLNRESTLCYPLNTSFEILVFLLLENAIKYSPEAEEVSVTFYEKIRAHELGLLIEIKSKGPHCSPEEIGQIFKKGFRSSSARKVEPTGSGVGLYFAQELAKQHKIALSASCTDNGESINDVRYGDFALTLSFDQRLLNSQY